MASENFTTQLIYQSEWAELSFLPEPGILWLIWKAKVSSSIIQEVYEQLFRQMQSRQVKHVLLDVSKRGRATAADETWMMREFVPRLLQHFKEGIYLAYLLDGKHYQALKAESPNGSLESLSPLLSINYFKEENKAFTWLAAKNLRTVI